MVIERDASGGVAVAGAGSPDDHVIDGVVILLIDLRPRVQQVVPESVQLREVNAQIRDTEELWGFRGGEAGNAVREEGRRIEDE